VNTIYEMVWGQGCSRHEWTDGDAGKRKGLVADDPHADCDRAILVVLKSVRDLNDG
jgi:hypothetical protein